MMGELSLCDDVELLISLLRGDLNTALEIEDSKVLRVELKGGLIG
jgi:hypothetical protein